jgi:hypothetical protein
LPPEQVSKSGLLLLSQNLKSVVRTP